MPEHMTYDVEHLYLTLGGALVGGEEWQFGTRWTLTESGASVGEVFDAIGLDDIRDHAATWYGFTQNMFPTDSNYSWAKLAHIGLDGKYAQDSRFSELVPPQAGGSTGGGLTTWAPVQTSLCISVRSDETLGRANRGRIYLPPIVYGRAANTVGITDPVRTAVLSAFHTFLWSVAGEMYTVGGGARLSIMSKIGPGKHKLATKLLLGNIIDTQRRRREQYDETYETAPWSTGEVPGPGLSSVDESNVDPYLAQVTGE